MASSATPAVVFRFSRFQTKSKHHEDVINDDKFLSKAKTEQIYRQWHLDLIKKFPIFDTLL